MGRRVAKSVIEKIKLETGSNVTEIEDGYFGVDAEGKPFAVAQDQLKTYQPDVQVVTAEQVLEMIDSRSTGELNNVKPQDEVTMDTIKQQIHDVCTVSKYHHLCMKKDTPDGLAWVYNRCISMMVEDNLHLDSALAQLESELENNN